jgi:hypothetical protein
MVVSGLAYEFRYMVEPSADEFPLGERTVAASGVFALPAGAVTVVVYVQAATDAASGPRDLPAGQRVELPQIQVEGFNSAVVGGRRRLLQTGSALSTAAIYEAHKAALLDPSIKRGDVYAAAGAVQILGIAYAPPNPTADSGSCADERSVELTAVTSAALVAFAGLDAGAAPTSVYTLQAACAVAAATRAPAELSLQGAGAALGVVGSKLIALAAGQVQLAPFGGATAGDPFECFVDALAQSMRGLQLHCHHGVDSTHHAQTLEGVDALLRLGQVAVNAMDVGAANKDYDTAAFHMRLVKGSQAEAGGGVSVVIDDVPPEGEGLVSLALVLLKGPALEDDVNVLGNVALVYSSSKAITVTFQNVPPASQLPAGKSLGLRYRGCVVIVAWLGGLLELVYVYYSKSPLGNVRCSLSTLL